MTSQKHSAPGERLVGPDAAPEDTPPAPERIRAPRRFLLLASADGVACAVSLAAAVVLRFGLSVPPEHAIPYLAFFPLLIGWRLLTAQAFGLYDFKHRLTAADHFFGACGAALAGIVPSYLLLVLVQAYYWPEIRLSRAVVLFDLVLLTAWFTASRAWILAALRRRGYKVRVLLVGSSAECDELAEEIRRQAPGLLEVVGGISVGPGDGASEAPRLEERLRRGTVDQVIAVRLRLSQKRLRDFLAQCDRAGVDLYLYPDLDLSIAAGTRVTSIAGLPVLSLRPAFLSTPYRVGKRLLDVAVALVLLPLCLPLGAAIALAVKLDSPGPVFFTQERVGLRGRVFRLSKFRTMVADAEAGSGPTLATPDDPRVTRVGRFLRRSRLDELPQLWDVLRGRMSLVGPRPERPEFVAQFIEENPLYERRFLVRPGLTGLAQIHGRYDSYYSHKLRYDLIYLNGVSLGMDLRILLATVRTVLTGRGAA